MLYNILRSLVLMYFNVLYSFNLDLGVKYLIGCDATADVDDVLIPLNWTYFVLRSKSKIPDHVLYRIGPRSAPWRISYDPANTIGGNQKRRDTLLPTLSMEDMVPLLDQVRHIILHYVYIVYGI